MSALPQAHQAHTPAPMAPTVLQAQRVEGAVSARAVQQRFAGTGRAQLGEGLADAAERIDQQLAYEADLSRRWQGLPGTDHPRHWRPDAGDEAQLHHGRSEGRRLDVQLPFFWTQPLTPREAGDQLVGLPLAQRLDELEALVRRHLPAAWVDDEVEVTLDVETRLYWGARGAVHPGAAARRLSAHRVDQTHAALPLFSFAGPAVVPGTLDEGDLQPRLKLTLKPGVAWLVAVPVLRFERALRRSERWRAQAGQWWRRVLARLGFPTRQDCDPTFISRLQTDEPVWAARLGCAPLPAATLAAQARSGGLLRSASRPARLFSERQPVQAPAHLVLVHGGLSSGLHGFGELLGPQDAAQDAGRADGAMWAGMPLLDGLPVWRFEHDSFVPVAHNIRRLVAEVERHLLTGPAGPRHVVLLAHSRGGNVVRFGLPALRRRLGRRGFTFAAVTLGSPHLGTSVFSRVGARWHGLAGLVGGVRRLSSPWLDRDQLATLVNLERGLAYEVPPGFHDVEYAGVCRMSGNRPDELPPGLWTVGSHWGPAEGVEGEVWDLVVEDLMGAEDESDGLVGLQSATGLRPLRPLAEVLGPDGLPAEPAAFDARPVFHTQYLSHVPTREAVARLLEAAIGWKRQA